MRWCGFFVLGIFTKKFRKIVKTQNDQKGQKVKTIIQYLFSKIIGKFFCFLGLYISLIVNSQAAGFVDVSALSVSPSPVTIGQDFDISFSLKEYQGDQKTFEYVEVWIQQRQKSGEYIDLYTVERWNNISFSANQTRRFQTTTFLDPARGRTPGAYYAVVRGKLAGDTPFNFGVVPGSNASNPYQFAAVSLVGRVDVLSSSVLSWDAWCAPQSEVVGIGNEFDVRFTLTEYYNSDKEFEYIEVWVQDESGNDLYRVQQWLNEKFLPLQTKTYITNRTFLDPAKGREPGLYRVIIRGKVAGDAPFDFNGIGGGVNPKSFTAVQRDGVVDVFGSRCGYFCHYKPKPDGGLLIQQGERGYLGFILNEGMGNNNGCGSVVLDYIEMWIQDGTGKDLWILNRWENVSFTYGQIRDLEFITNIFIDPAKYKLGNYQAVMRGKIAGATPFIFNENMLAPWNGKYSIKFEVSQGQEPSPYTCKTLDSGLNTCILSPGDILFTVAKDRDALRMIGGTYWFHTGMYLGDGIIAEAKGHDKDHPKDEVWTKGIDQSDWAKKSDEGIIDWSVIRPITNQTTKNAAVNYARNKANQGNDDNEQPILFQTPQPFITDINREDKFYCAQLAWKSYEKQGLDLQTKLNAFLWTQNLVLPDDLYLSSAFNKSNLIAEKPGVWRLLITVFSPVDILLIDDQGRRTGFDATTGTILDEIPGTTYTGPESEPEAITATGVEGNLELHVVGNQDGQYTLEAVDLDLNNVRSQVVTRDTLPGKVEVYAVVQGQEKIVIPPNRPPVANAGSNQTIECTSPQGATVSLDGSKSFDPDGDRLIYLWTGLFGTASGQNPTVTLPLGTHTITLTVDDVMGERASATVTDKVVDTTPPTITSMTASPNTLWPPNHDMVPVQVTTTTSDKCTIAPVCAITSVTSNELDNGLGDGDMVPDWQITSDLTVNLRAERSGSGSGREYKITVQCTDDSSNSSSQSVLVKVPHN